MLLWLLALIRNYFSRGRHRCGAARQSPGLGALVEPFFRFSHSIHSPTVLASYSRRDAAGISERRNKMNQVLRLTVLDPGFACRFLCVGSNQYPHGYLTVI
jgi:hypothetical protein